MRDAADDPAVDPDILAYYSTAWDEDARIRSGLNELELVRTREVVERFLPAEPVHVLDVGGASGVHAEWLLQLGHDVSLVDPIPRHIDEAIASLGNESGFDAKVGDARRLDFDADAFDVVLLFGPLYHLQDARDRALCWSEASRVVKPGGLVFGAVISRFASLFSGLSEGVIFDPVFRDIVIRDLLDGRHTNPPGQDFFTTAYFHHPDEAKAEAVDAGLRVEAVLGVEGIAAWIPSLEDAWADPRQRQIIVESARAIEDEPSLLGLGPHVVVVARVPGPD